MSISEEREWTIESGASRRIAFRFSPVAPYVFVREIVPVPTGDEFEMSIDLEDFLAVADAIREMNRPDPLGDALDRSLREFTARKHGETEEPER
jgi:hypothetical protein